MVPAGRLRPLVAPRARCKTPSSLLSDRQRWRNVSETQISGQMSDLQSLLTIKVVPEHNV